MDQIVKLAKSGELLGQRSMVSDEPANLSAVAQSVFFAVAFSREAAAADFAVAS